MEWFCKELREHAMKIINYEKKKKEIIPLTDEENESYEKQNVCCVCKKEFNTDEIYKDKFSANENDKNEFSDDENDKNEFSADENYKNVFKPYHKVRDYCHYTGKFREAAHNICNSK